MTTADLLPLIPAAGLGGLFTWSAQAISSYFKARGARAQHKEDTDATLKQHSDKLVLDVVRVAREEVAAARVDLAESRNLQLRMVHFDEAMELLQLIYSATTPEERTSVERRVGQFLKRMERFNAANGAIRNELQVQQSRAAAGTIAAEAADILQKGLDDAK